MAIDKDELIADYQRVAEELGKRPTLAEYNDRGDYSQQPIYSKFGSFEDFKAAAGFATGEKKVPDEKLIQDLQRVADDIGRTPPVMVYDEHGEHNSKTLKRRFGNWNEVLQEAGLEPTDHSEHWKDVEPTLGEYGNTEAECATCGATIYRKQYDLDRYDRVFCDAECRNKWQAEQTGQDAYAWEGGNVPIDCEICGQTRMVKPARADTSRFCSQECMLEWRSELFTGEGHPRWNPDSEEQYYGKNWYPQRRKALQRDNRECQLCGKDHEQHIRDHNREHDVHHIIPFDHFDDYRDANRLENLITLCAFCHQKVENGLLTVPAAQWHRIEATKATTEYPAQTP